MIQNTGNVALVLYGVLILGTIASLFLVFRIILKGKIDEGKLNLMVDLFKYAIVSVAIATTTMIISDLFKEREQDVKELEYFGTYVEDIKNADGIVQRYQLSKYLAIVAPSGELKKSWERYFDSVRIEYNEYLRDRERKQLLDTIVNPSPEVLFEKFQLDEKILMKEQPLQPGNNLSAASYYESLGFEKLLAGDVKASIENFKKSETAFNGFHNSYEISRYLSNNQNQLIDTTSNQWQIALKKIQEDYSYGMPPRFKDRLKKMSSGN